MAITFVIAIQIVKIYFLILTANQVDLIRKQELVIFFIKIKSHGYKAFRFVTLHLMKWSDKKGVQHLVAICAEKGVKYVVISPGSRNAPITISFNRYPGFQTIVIPDERVAAFFAMGIAQQTDNVVALVCTSGSAMLNYSPALVEAYYAHTPMIVITADRPGFWIDQREGQSIRQQTAYGDFIKGTFNLPLESDKTEDIELLDEMVSKAINLAHHGNKGPVHINVPLDEPLYDLVELKDVRFNLFEQKDSTQVLEANFWDCINSELASYNSVMVLVGQSKRECVPSKALEALLANEKTVVLSECTSNFIGGKKVGCIDRNIMAMDDHEWEKFQPELLITIGGAIVSKKIKQKLRLSGVKAHWHVSEFDGEIDTFKHLSKVVACDAKLFFDRADFSSLTPNYFQIWNAQNESTRKAHDTVIKDLPYSDMVVFDKLLDLIPEGSQVHLANSSPVRYAQLFDHRSDMEFFGNRGVSGIDGSTSTAMGAACVGHGPVTLITGDMSFFYDSNAFWHKHVPANFKCIVINNGGGGIFRIIQGPNEVEELEEFFEVHQENKVDKIAEAFGVDYMKAENLEELSLRLTELYNKNDAACILEVVTPRDTNSEILKEYFTKIKLLKYE